MLYLTAKFSKLVGREGQVILADINSSMLNVGRDKLRDKGLVQNIEYVQANAEYLPFEENTFDIVTIAFGLRNVTDKDKALRSIYSVLNALLTCVLFLTKSTNSSSYCFV